MTTITTVMTQCLPRILTLGEPQGDAFLIGSSGGACPIIIDSHDSEAVHIAARTFAADVAKVVGTTPTVLSSANGCKTAVVVCTIASQLATSLGTHIRQQRESLTGKWESFDISVLPSPLPGLDEALVVLGSDRRGAMYGLYTLSDQMGVSPWHWWSDVPVKTRRQIGFPRDSTLQHGEPSVKYRGFFINDEQPVLWNWAKEHFRTGQGPPFQTGIYEKLFELCLRLRGNYMWPAMWSSMFSVDGLDISDGLPLASGPNQVLAERMGIVMGTSHHEPMAKNQKEFTDFGSGDWDYTTNQSFLDDFWRHGVARAKGKETVFTVGMRGDGDLPLEGANIDLLQRIVRTQQHILRECHPDTKLDQIPQVWAMYKEVMAYYAEGLSVPDEVTSLLADDNWGNLMAVLPEHRQSTGESGIYYHADYVGDPRSYKWLSTVSLAKMWEQLYAAYHFKTTNIWIINVGDLKFLELPLEYFMNLAYDFGSWRLDSLPTFLHQWSARQFGVTPSAAPKIASILLRYSVYASRRKAELLDAETYSLVHHDEWSRVIDEWDQLENDAKEIHQALGANEKLAFEQLVFVSVRLYANLNRMYCAVAKANLYATQSRSSTNLFSRMALEYFEKDRSMSRAFHDLNDGKWRHMLSQPHIGYQYWQAPLRDSMPAVPMVAGSESSVGNQWCISTRFAVEGMLGAWPGDNKHNSSLGYGAPDPVLVAVDRYSRPRWVEVFSAGPENTTFTATTDCKWLRVSPSFGAIAHDGSTDTRVNIDVDWADVPACSLEQELSGHVRFQASDGAAMSVTVPLACPSSTPPGGFRGFVEADSYVAIEAEHYDTLDTPGPYRWQKIEAYGRTLSGMAVYPLTQARLTPETRPGIRYSFWLGKPIQDDSITLTLHVGPTLNYVLGKPFLWHVQLDSHAPICVQPIPTTPPGSLPDDWEDVVAREIRVVELSAPAQGVEAGAHSLTIWAESTGLVLERVIIHRHGLNSSYLGPLESVLHI